jgi:small subunit ribosomal protein S14
MLRRRFWDHDVPSQVSSLSVRLKTTWLQEAERGGQEAAQIDGGWLQNRLRKRVFPLASAFLMAKTSWINRNDRKRKTVKKYAALRAELKAKKDYIGLSQLPRDASPTRVVNRCQVTGRRRAFIRRFKISRLTFRELASAGLIPGVTKSSW